MEDMIIREVKSIVTVILLLRWRTKNESYFFPEFEQRMISSSDLDGVNSPVIYQPYSNLDSRFLEYMVESSSQPNALVELGERYHFGVDGFEQDYNKAFYYLKKAADYGSPEALFLVADYYRLGYAVEKDYSKYFYYLEKAADSGSYMAWMNMATAYHFGKERYNGFGYEQNDEKCIQCNINAVSCIEIYWNRYTQSNFRGYQGLIKRSFNCFVRNVDLISQYYEVNDKAKAKYWLEKGNDFVLKACGKTYPIFDEALSKL